MVMRASSLNTQEDSLNESSILSLNDLNISIRKRKDIEVKESSLMLYGEKQHKKMNSQTLTWSVPIYQEIIIEKVKGKGKVSYREKVHKKNESQSWKVIYDSSISKFSSVMGGGSKKLQLIPGKVYEFKLDSAGSDITFTFRNKYSLDV